jgi:hypothetical protein
MADLHTIRVYSKRLERYSHRVTDKVLRGGERDLIAAMNDAAEASEISRRLYNQLQAWLQQQPQRYPSSSALQEDPDT